MKKQRILTVAAAFGVLSMLVSLPAPPAGAQGGPSKDFKPPIVFQAAGPNAESIQSSVDAFRAALGEPDNGNEPGPRDEGRREINWDGGGANDTTTPPVTPFDVFLNIRGAQFSTPGKGLSQAPPEGGPEGGLAELFNNPTYRAIFSTFSPLRLFTPVDSNSTEALFFVPGTEGKEAAVVRGFGAVFTDVEQPDGSKTWENQEAGEPSTLIEYFDADDKLLFSSFVPASPGDGSLSFFGIVFDDARIARVKITSGNVAPGPDDDAQYDIVMMDDFIYGEPQPLSDYQNYPK